MYMLRKTRRNKGMGQKEVAYALGVAQPTISAWENGTKTPTLENLKALAELYGVSVDYLIESKSPMRGIKIPVLGRVPAGVPLEAIQEILDYEEITPEMASTGDHFALIIKGDSMLPRMSDGDVVIVRKQSDVTNGDTAVVVIDGHDATVKRVLKQENGIILQPTNSAHKPLFFTPDQVRDLPVAVIGRVVELRAKF